MTFIKDMVGKFTNSEKKNGWPGLIEAYKKWLPVNSKTPIDI